MELSHLWKADYLPKKTKTIVIIFKTFVSVFEEISSSRVSFITQSLVAKVNCRFTACSLVAMSLDFPFFFFGCGGFPFLATHHVNNELHR